MPTFKLSNGLDMNYKDIGEGFPIIIVHGTPSSSDEFINLIQILKKNYRIIACDHIGFGESVKPSNYSYLIKDHQNNFNEFMSFLNLSSLNIIVHDFGGIIALPYIIDNLNKVSNLVISNSWAWKMSKIEYFPFWMRSLMSSKVARYLYLEKNFSPRFFVKLAWGEFSPLDAEKHNKYISKFKTSSERHGTWGFAQALVNENDIIWKIENQLSKLNGAKTLLLWGGADKLITLKSMNFWKLLLPNARVRKLEKVGHFLFDEAPELCAAELLDFFQDNE
ncbi:alpha/beta hydrolase [Pigmentibacter sp. JX0631]|uniref:alpha/beta fold hydrolase n=1 Tax=Pigmentibacter sp. JX0631 TaxID=2976982 RepID=UPI002469966C|nr:alpha/beta hydrolase [Pigmentibacter sp. JX0631]WGL59260.1 alpha/beta hydrolase [Pigmentibacter sp. JX0631]